MYKHINTFATISFLIKSIIASLSFNLINIIWEFLVRYSSNRCSSFWVFFYKDSFIRNTVSLISYIFISYFTYYIANAFSQIRRLHPILIISLISLFIISRMSFLHTLYGEHSQTLVRKRDVPRMSATTATSVGQDRHADDASRSTTSIPSARTSPNSDSYIF